MAKNVYLIISDLHNSVSVKLNRVNYEREIIQVQLKILKLIEQYKSIGYAVNLIFLGDIFDRGYNQISKGIQSNNMFVIYKNECKQIYSVVGNHELEYYTDNPFFTLMTDIKSQKLKENQSKVCTPRGILQLVNVVDTLIDGEVCFYFNHFDCPVTIPLENNKIKVNIGLYHQNIVSQEILNNMRCIIPSNIDYIPKVNFNEYYSLYDYSFFGHFHKIYGKWKYKNELNDKESVLYYLASLGRPNYTEVSNKMLERNIPAIIIEEGLFKRIEDNFFNLQTEEESIKRDMVEVQKLKYEKIKENKEIRNYIPTRDNPIENVILRCGSDTNKQILQELMINKTTKIEQYIDKSMKKIMEGE